LGGIFAMPASVKIDFKLFEKYQLEVMFETIV
jgi:hypothetical protein